MKNTSANLKSTDMKKLFILSTIVAASLAATTAYSQVYVNAHVGLRLPGVRIYAAPAPVVYQAPAPVYQDEYAPAPVYQDGYDQAPGMVYDNEFPGYAYYDYPVWNGHYRDRSYYAHYRPYFERDHRAYFNGGRFDHARFDRDHSGGSRDHNRGGGRDHRGRR
jgi:hypothetical protein